MSTKTLLWSGIIGILSTIPLIQTIAIAKSPTEIGDIAKAITVLISDNNAQGSGVILQHQGDIYTILTAAHVVREQVNYKITAPDNHQYQMVSNSIRFASGNIDLAVVKFRSTANYPIAKLGNSNINALKMGMDLYLYGFPSKNRVVTKSILLFRDGKVSANSSQIVNSGYSLIYSNDTLEGMSGGPILNIDGDLVAIHGRGDLDKNGTPSRFNSGIPIHHFITVANSMGIGLDRAVTPVTKSTVLRADDYIALANQQSQKRDYRGSITPLDRAIQLVPNNAESYYRRGIAKNELGDYQGAISDYNQAIKINPNDAYAYNDRGILKENKLQDYQGALADYNQAIQLKPNFTRAYINRLTLRQSKLYDSCGVLADYNRIKKLDPTFISVIIPICVEVPISVEVIVP